MIVKAIRCCGEDMRPMSDTVLWCKHCGSCWQTSLRLKHAPDGANALRDELDATECSHQDEEAAHAETLRLLDLHKKALAAAVRVMQYAAGSFAQVPRDKTVPPIVLHDCKDKLDECWREVDRLLGRTT